MYIKIMMDLSLGVFLLLLIFQVEGCTVTWTETEGIAPSGGKSMKVAAISLKACKDKCVAQESCVGVAWEKDSICRTYTVGPKKFVTGTHSSYYIRGSCAVGCNWSGKQGKAYHGGNGDVSKTAKSLDACTNECAANSECMAVDWIKGSTCWQFLSSGYVIAQADSIHYEKDRDNCVLGCDWTVSLKTQRASEGAKTTAKSLDACQTNCAAQRSCVGITWEGGRNTCRIYTKRGRLVNRNLVNGAGYYYDKGKCVEGCTWTATENTSPYGGEGQQTKSKSLEACKAECAADVSCRAIDWKDNGTCWNYQTTAALVGEVGTTHYACQRPK